MTREEQIDWLCRLRADLNNEIIFTPWNKEFTEALTGILEQEPKTDVLDELKSDVFNACSDNYHMPVYKLDCDEIFEIIDKYRGDADEVS